jgi:hypothetical protein
MPSLPEDQTKDDLKSITLDSAPLENDIEIMGNPHARVRVSSDRPVAKIALRLTEVLPDGKSWLVSYGILNLTHRSSHADPTPLTVDVFYDVDLPLYMVAHRFKRGSKIRIAISESLFPLVWPSPEIVTLTVDAAGSNLTLPVRTAPIREQEFLIPVIHSKGTSPYMQSEAGPGAQVTFDSPLESKKFDDIGTTVETQTSEKLTMEEGQPNSGFWTQTNSTAWKRGNWSCKVSASFELTSTATEFNLKELVCAMKDEREIFRRERISKIKRDLL